MNQTKQPLTKQEIEEVSEILAKKIAREKVLAEYSSTPEDAQKWGYVENTWEDKEFQDAAFEAFIEKALKGDPWEGFNGKDAF